MSSTGMPNLDAVSEPRILDRRYRLERRRSEGAHGVVYEAFHLGLKRRVAIKLLAAHPDEPAAGRFRREAEALGRLEHPHVVKVFDSGLDPESGRPYLAMEMLDGETLADRLGRKGGLPPEEALPLLAAVASAVDEAHGQGILHRDLKPENVLVAPSGVKVLDFGLAKLVAEAAGAAGDPADPAMLPEATGSWGTPLYAAPELFRGEPASRASDLYALAVLAYQALAGHPPFRGSLAEVVLGHRETEPPPSPGLSPEVLSALRRAMNKRPEDRPASARDLVLSLAEALDRPILCALRERRRRDVRRKGIVLAAILALVAPLATRFSIPPVERFFFDLFSGLAPVRPPDGRLLLVTFDGDPGAPPGRSLAERGDEIAAGSEEMLAAGALGVAFDLLLPESWSRSSGFVRLAAGHPEAVVLAAHSVSGGEVIGTGAAAGLLAAALGPARSAALFGFVNVDEDSDGRVRKGRLAFRTNSGARALSWAARVAGRLSGGGARGRPPAENRAETFWIDPGLREAEYPSLLWSEARRRLEAESRFFSGRMVLLGAGTRAGGDDVHRVSRVFGPARSVAGLVLEARMADTIAAGLPLRDAPAAPTALAIFAITVGAGLAVLRAPRLRAALGLAFAMGGLWLTLSLVAFVAAGRVVPVASSLAAMGASVLAATMLRRSLPSADKEPYSIP